jgi:DNA-binding beta-propeller fold protein YncE
VCGRRKSGGGEPTGLMRLSIRHLQLLSGILALAALALPAGALGGPLPPRGAKHLARSAGTLVQLPGGRGCVVDRSTPQGECRSVRALEGPAPLLGSRAIALSPDGRNVYVASSGSDAIAVFLRNPRTGALTQGQGAAGCIAAKGADGCATAVGLDGPNSVAVSPDGLNVYATSVKSETVTTFRRNPKTGALRQRLDGSGCVAGAPLPLCDSGRALLGADVVVVSPDGRNVYVGSFFGNAIAIFDRDAAGGALTQPSDSSGCLVETPVSGCTTGIALNAIEGLAISGDGKNVYAGAAASEAVDILSRNPSTGALTQATDGSGCIVTAPLPGCTTGAQLGGADAVAVSPDDKDVYVTSLFSKSVTSFTRSSATGGLTQKPGPSGCLVFMRSAGCSFGRALNAPEGLAISPEGDSVYAASYAPGAIAVLARKASSGALAQKPRKTGCLGAVPDCSPGRALSGLGSLAVSPDGRYLYAAASKSDAIAVFRRAVAPRLSAG